MAKHSSRILVINDEHLVLREFVKGLNAAARTLDNPLGIGFVGVTTAKEALALIESDGDLQAVLGAVTLYTHSGKNNANRKKSNDPLPAPYMAALPLVQRTSRFLPQLYAHIRIA